MQIYINTAAYRPVLFIPHLMTRSERLRYVLCEKTLNRDKILVAKYVYCSPLHVVLVSGFGLSFQSNHF